MMTMEQLIEENKKLKEEIKHLRNRNAGRKRKFNSYQITLMKALKKQGWTYKRIAEKNNCSTSLVYKMLNNN